MRPLIPLLAAVLILSMTTLATAGDCPGGVCPLEKNATVLPGTIEVTAVGIVAERPARIIAKPARRSARLLKAIVKNTAKRKPARRIVAGTKRVLKLPRRGLCRRHN